MKLQIKLGQYRPLRPPLELTLIHTLLACILKKRLAHEINDFSKFVNIFTNRLEQLKEYTTAGASTCQLM